MSRGAVALSMVEPEAANLLPEERLFRAVIEDSIRTLQDPEAACKRLHMGRHNAQRLLDMERDYVRSALFEVHCSWARLDPFKLRLVLRRSGLV